MVTGGKGWVGSQGWESGLGSILGMATVVLVAFEARNLRASVSHVAPLDVRLSQNFNLGVRQSVTSKGNVWGRQPVPSARTVEGGPCLGGASVVQQALLLSGVSFSSSLKCNCWLSHLLFLSCCLQQPPPVSTLP